VRFTPLPVDHIVPAYGYLVANAGASVLFSGTRCRRPDCGATPRRASRLKAIFLEVSFSDTQAEVARASCH
jgi:hypothetical protein